MSQDTEPPKKSIPRKSGKLGSNHAVKFSTQKKRERKGPSQSAIQMCEPHEPQSVLKNTRKEHKMKPCNKNEDHERERGDLLNSDQLEWLQAFRENLVDDRVPERRDSPVSSSHGLSLEPTSSADLGKHRVYTHFPERPKLRDLPESVCGLNASDKQT